MVRVARQIQRAWLGAALIIGLLGSALLIFFLDDVIAAFQQRYAIVVVLDRAPGLIAGSPVWIGGKEVGNVTRVELLPTGPDTLVHVAVTVELPRTTYRQVRGDSRVRITSAGLVGQPVVDLEPGSAAAPVLGPGDTLRMQPRRSFSDVAAHAAAVRANIDTTLQLMKQLGPSVRARVEDTQRTLVALEAAMAQTNRLRSDISASPALVLLRDPAFAASLEHSREHATELSRLLGSLPQRVSQAGDVGAALGRLRLRADSLRAQLDATAAAMQGGFLTRSQRDSALLRAVTAARTELDSLIAETRRNPLRYFF